MEEGSRPRPIYDSRPLMLVWVLASKISLYRPTSVSGAAIVPNINYSAGGPCCFPAGVPILSSSMFGGNMKALDDCEIFPVRPAAKGW